MNTIFWKGVFSTTIEGLLISELPPISKPPLRVKETTIDGRDGSIIEELGYSSYDKTITIGLRGNFNINKVIKYFTGEGEIIFSNEPEKVYTAKIVDQIDYNRLLRFRTAIVKFRVQPYKHKYNEAYKETQTATATGTSIAVNDSAESKLKAFSIYGKSTQNGTPTPDAPVEMVSVGAGGSIAVSATDGNGNTQTVEVQTPNGLHGIHVDSGGNYTDASGQQWACDEIDFEHGKMRQKIIHASQFAWRVAENNGYPVGNSLLFCHVFSEELGGASIKYRASLCNKLPYDIKVLNNDSNGFYFYYGNAYARIEGVSDEATFNNLMSGAEMLIELDTPREVNLSKEEISAYANLHTSKPNTTVLNNANANMKVEYFKPFEVFNEGLESSKPIMMLRGTGTVGISVNGIHIFDYTFPEGETEVVIDSEKEDAYLGNVLKNRHMNGEFPVLLAGTNKIEWSGDVESIEILPRSRWL